MFESNGGWDDLLNLFGGLSTKADDKVYDIIHCSVVASSGWDALFACNQVTYKGLKVEDCLLRGTWMMRKL